MKDWLYKTIFKKQIEDYYERTAKIFKEKDNEIKNLKERIKYLNFEITKLKGLK